MLNNKTCSAQCQDLFILKVLDKKKNGTYLEIGASHPITDNNTYLLETEFGWTGVSVEWNVQLGNMFNITRKNPCALADATQIDYTSLLQACNMPTHIDYLQLDIDPPDNTFKALNNINFNQYSFSIITYEHDFYAGGFRERIESRKILESYGYTRIFSDVMHDNSAFEDWYVNEKYMPNDNWKLFIDSSKPMNSQRLTQKYIDIFNTL